LESPAQYEVEVNWGERNWWFVLAGVVALTAWQLTRWITQVNHAPHPVIVLTFNETRATGVHATTLSITALRELQNLPSVSLASPSTILLGRPRVRGRSRSAGPIPGSGSRACPRE
jgi:hypothetical protein